MIRETVYSTAKRQTSKDTKEKRLSLTKSKLQLSDSKQALETMSDEDMSYINPEDGPTKLFGIQGLYQKLKTE